MDRQTSPCLPQQRGMVRSRLPALSDEVSRKYIQSLKRLMTFTQSRVRPS